MEGTMNIFTCDEMDLLVVKIIIISHKMLPRNMYPLVGETVPRYSLRDLIFIKSDSYIFWAQTPI